MPEYTDIVDVDDLMEAMAAETKRRSLKDLEEPEAPDYEPNKSEAPVYKTSKSVPAATAQTAELYDSKTYDDKDFPHTQGHHTANPFAPREGKTLVWRDVNMTLVR
jgi:hypothetical protein